MDMHVEPTGSEDLSPRTRRDETTEMDVIDAILQALPRMMRADRKLRAAFIEQSAATIAILIRDRTDAVRQHRMVVEDAYHRTTTARYKTETERIVLHCRREQLRTRMDFVAYLIQDAKEACSALDADETLMRDLISEMYEGEIARHRALWEGEQNARR